MKGPGFCGVIVGCSLLVPACGDPSDDSGAATSSGPASGETAATVMATGDTGASTGSTPVPTSDTGDTGVPTVTGATGTITGDTSGDTDDTSSTTDDTGPIVYPEKRVGMFYLGWHAFAWDAVSKVDPAQPRTVEAVIRGGDLQFSDMILNAGLFNEAAAFHWHVEPSLGFYSLYRPRDGEAPYAEPNLAPPYPDTAAITTAHAAALWDAGVDFIYMDLTNVPGMSDFSDVIGLRPFQVLLEEWGALRAQGVPTPQVAAWVPASDVGDATPMFRRLLDEYDAAAPDLILRHAGQPVMFIVDHAGLPILQAHLDEISARGVLPVRLWGVLQSNALAAGTAAWMQPCSRSGEFNTLIDSSTSCDQGYTTTSPLGTVLSVSRSFQIGYASLPLQAAGRLGGLTFIKQFATALAVQPNYLLINAWNEHIAQPQPNPYDPALGPLRRSMGLGDAPNDDPSADWLWVDMYGAEYDRDFEPTVEDGGAGYELLKSCLRVWRTGATTCSDGAEACCQLPEDRVLIRSLRKKGGPLAGEHVPTNDANEVATLLGNGGWDEVCNPHYGPPGLCGGGTTGDGPFRLYTAAGPGRVALYRCYTGVDNFLSTDANCEGTQIIKQLGYAATTPTSDSARPLTRCLTQMNVHLHWLEGPCPPGTTGEAVLGYVR